ncbi:hypothetical protein JCM30760_13600 [Thiomicrorhabdus hydrogeniphila]
MNELQQVLLIFAVVVIAGLYFLSRSRQNTVKKPAQKSNETSSQTSHANQNNNEPVLGDIPLSEQNESQEQASEALNNLGSPHIPVSETTERRFTESRGVVNTDNSADFQNQTEDYNQNQGVLFFGEEFDLKTADQSVSEQDIEENLAPMNMTTNPDIEESVNLSAAPEQPPQKTGGKHHVLVVDDPGMTGEIDDSSNSSDFIKPSFGIPEEEKTTKTYKSSTNKEPEVYVLLVMTTAQEFAMTDVNQALLGVGLTYSEQGIFVKNDNMGNAFIKVANMLEPGSFPQENLQNYATPGVAMILELPTTVRAPAAMHDLIMMARKVSQRLQGRLYNAERQLIKESDLQSMRDAALDYESIPIA